MEGWIEINEKIEVEEDIKGGIWGINERIEWRIRLIIFIMNRK